MTYNTDGIHWGHMDSEFGSRFLKTIDSIQPHILVLQEMKTNYSDSVCNELKNKYHYNSLVELSKLNKSDKNAACLFSLYPIKSFFRYSYDKLEIDSVYKDSAIPDSVKRPINAEVYNSVIDIDGHETLVICCHLKSNDYSKLRHEHSNNWFYSINNCISGYRKGSAVRSLDAKMICDSIAKYNLPTIVCGDMNDFEWSRAVKIIAGGNLKNVWWERGLGFGNTYDRFHLKIRIDHIFISNEIKAVHVDVPHLYFSDHYPIVSDLMLN